MKFFIDTADVKEIRAAHAMGCVDGVTTNPSLLAKVGRPLEETIREICSIVDGPISAECVSLDAPDLIKEGKELAKIHDNVVVKIPMGTEGMKAVKALTAEGIRTNVTLVLLARTRRCSAPRPARPTSRPFVGRLDDISEDGMELIANIIEIYRELRLRDPGAGRRACATRSTCSSPPASAPTSPRCPFSVIQQLAQHPLTDIGIKKFLADWEKVPKAAK